ncbi:MAG: ATP-binding protein, partial [Candidatus Limnocylindria bacterium]
QADPDSIQLWHYVARTSQRRRLAIVSATRPPATGSALAQVSASLEARGDLSSVPLAPLAPDSVATLLGGFGVGADDVAWLAPALARWTGGNPFFVLEALRALVELRRLTRDGGAWTWSGARPSGDGPIASELPPTVRQTILGRLGALPKATRRLVDLGAVVGPAARIELLAEVAGRDEMSVAEDVGDAIEAGLLRETREGSIVTLAFAHDLVREATYQQIPIGLRAALHRRVGAALERAAATRGAIAFHLTRGGDAERGAEHWLASAREAEDRSAYDDAIRGYRAALEALGPTSARKHEILTRIGDAEMRRGAAASAVAAYDEALVLLPVEDVDDRATLSVRIASTARYYERHPQALEHATAAVEHYRARGDDERLASALAAIAWVHYVDGDARAARAMAEEARAIARAHDLVRIEAEALQVAVGARWFAGEVVAAPDPADLERLVARLGDDEQAARLIEMSAVGIQRQGRPLDALALARRALRIARRVGSLRAQLRAGEQVVGLLVITGSYREAAQLADEIAADVASLELSRTDLLGELVLALALGGEEQRARGLAGELLTGISPTSSRPLHADPAGLAIDALLSLGDGPDPALVEALRPTCRTCEIGWHALAGRALAMAGEQGRALALADELEKRVRETGYLSQAGAPDHVRAVAMSRAGRMDEASAAAERARARFRSTGHARGEDVLDRDLARISALRA